MLKQGQTAWKAGLIALALSFNPLAAQADDGPKAAAPEFNANFTLPNPTGGAGLPITVPVDCDLLDEHGQSGIDFVRQFDIWGHLTRETDVTRAQNHLRTHGIMPERVEKVRQHCLEHYP